MSGDQGEALAALALRVEQATGPDRELDAAIAAVARVGLPAGCDWAFKFPRWEGEQFGQVRVLGNVNGNGDYISGRFVSPLFTASLDAAMTLVPEGAVWLRKSPETMSVYTPPPGKMWATHIDARGKTPALALCAAALRALREHIQSNMEGER